MPRVTVLLTTYNRPEMLKIAVESVQKQNYKDWELIVLDDNSSDLEQLKYLKELEDKENIYVYNSEVKDEDRGKTTRYATLINIALTTMDICEFVSYLCDDDFYYPERLEKMVEYLDTHPEANIVYGRQKLFIKCPDGRLEDFPTPYRDTTEKLDHARCCVDHSSVMMRKSMMDKVGLWNDHRDCWSEGDGVYWDKCNEAGNAFYGINQVLDAHVYHDGSWTKGEKWKNL